MTIHQRMWMMAQEVFGKGVFPLWVTIEQDADHAIWMWNDQYGPLNYEQREYAGDLICRALARAGEVEDTSHKLARYRKILDVYRRHEKTDVGFKRRAGEKRTGRLQDVLAESNSADDFDSTFDN